MIIPIKCFTCGMVIADKYRYYLEEVRRQKLAKQGSSSNKTKLNHVTYLTNEYHEKSPEGIVVDNLEITRMCCRRHFLTHVDIE